jgi:hypothetical protein
MSQHILDKAYRITDSGGVEAGRAVPGAANAAGVLGVTTHDQSLEGGNVSVRKAGIVRAVAAGAIPLGSPVNVAGSSGKVKAVNETSTQVNCLGFAESAALQDGDIVEVFLCPHERTVGAGE